MKSSLEPEKLNTLRAQISATLAFFVKSYKLPEVCVKFGLAEGQIEEAHSNKALYVESRLSLYSDAELLSLAKAVCAEYPNYKLDEIIEKLASSTGFVISELTRRALVRELDKLSSLSGHLGLLDFLGRIWPLREIEWGRGNASDAIFQHMVRNEDWSNADVCEFLNAYEISDKRFARLLEITVSPLVRDEADQGELVGRFNELLRKDNCELRSVEEQSGYAAFSVVALRGGVEGRVKNLVFAADGPKPEIVLSDAVNNDVAIVKNGEFCLVFDDPIPSTGLMWKHLVSWWISRNNFSGSHTEAARGLYKRLRKSLASEPEQTLFHEYYRRFRALGEALPALVPQVYLHYDPYTVRQLGGIRRLVRERMDFLLLLSNHHRVVVEIDGKHHYADGEIASPKRYAEMARADRELKLAGYEVYRFGGVELLDAQAKVRIGEFFERLLKKHHRM